MPWLSVFLLVSALLYCVRPLLASSLSFLAVLVVFRLLLSFPVLSFPFVLLHDLLEERVEVSLHEVVVDHVDEVV